MKIGDIINEAIPLRLAKPYRREWNPDTNKELFAKFGAKYRIYIPFTSEIGAVQAPEELTTYLKRRGYTITNYVKGYATDEKGKQIFKIGKLLAGDPELQQAFQSDPQRDAKDVTEFYCVISRHPYDIASMSTGRHWKSCMNLVKGEEKAYVMNDVKLGTIVAYAVKKSDKNINKPFTRVAIKPFVNVHDSNDILYVSENKMYGAKIPGLLTTIDKWLEKVNGSKANGLYCRTKNLYNDDNDPIIINRLDNNFRFNDKMKITDPEEQKSIAKKFWAMSPRKAAQLLKSFVKPPIEILLLAYVNNNALQKELPKLYTMDFVTSVEALTFYGTQPQSKRIFEHIVVLADSKGYTFNAEQYKIILQYYFTAYYLNADEIDQMAETDPELKKVIQDAQSAVRKSRARR